MNLINRLGHRYGRLEVIERVPRPENRGSPGSTDAWWLCRCDCGKTIPVSSNNMRKTPTQQSCGCAQRDHLKKIAGLGAAATKARWAAIKSETT